MPKNSATVLLRHSVCLVIIVIYVLCTNYSEKLGNANVICY